MSYGLTYRGVSLWRADGSVRLRIVEGRWFDPPQIRGTNRVIPARPGQRRRNRVIEYMPIVMDGHIEGQGATLAAKRANYLALRAELAPLWDATLVAAGQLVETQLDVAGTEKVALADFVSAMWDREVLGFFVRARSIELHAVTPPFWANVGP